MLVYKNTIQGPGFNLQYWEGGVQSREAWHGHFRRVVMNPPSLSLADILSSVDFTLCSLSVKTQNRDSLEVRPDSDGLWAQSEMLHTGQTKERGR